MNIVDHRSFGLLVLSVLVMSGSAVFVSGQASRSIFTTGRRLDEIGRQIEKSQRDELGRELGSKPQSPEQLRRTAALKAQIKEDFESMQEQYNRLVTQLKLKKPLDREFVAGTAAVIHKHARRLRENVPFPKSDPQAAISETARPNGDPSSLEAETANLCQKIHSFLTSPMFETTAVLDVNQAEKARSLLDEILYTASHLRGGLRPGN